MRSACGDCDKKTVLRSTRGAGGNGDGGRLRCPGGARGNRYLNIFFDGNWRGARSALADAIEIGIVKLARKIEAALAITKGQIFASEKSCGVGIRICGNARRQSCECAWCRFFV